MSESTPIDNADLKPCAVCGGKLGMLFWVFDERVAAINEQRANALMGTVQILGGNLVIAQAMTYTSVAEMSSEPTSRRFLCNECRCRMLELFRCDSEEPRMTADEEPQP